MKPIVPTWPTLVTGCVLCGVIGYAAAQATRDALPGLTAQDRLEIQELLHRYMFVLDSCPDHNSGYDYADLYTKDGQFASQDVQFGMTVTGRDALAALAGRMPDGSCSAIRRRGPTNQVHLNLAPIIEAAPEGAKGISYLLMIDGPGHEVTGMAGITTSMPGPRRAGASRPGFTWEAAPLACQPTWRQLAACGSASPPQRVAIPRRRFRAQARSPRRRSAQMADDHRAGGSRQVIREPARIGAYARSASPKREKSRNPVAIPASSIKEARASSVNPPSRTRRSSRAERVVPVGDVLLSGAPPSTGDGGGDSQIWIDIPNEQVTAPACASRLTMPSYMGIDT